MEKSTSNSKRGWDIGKLVQTTKGCAQASGKEAEEAGPTLRVAEGNKKTKPLILETY